MRQTEFDKILESSIQPGSPAPSAPADASLDSFSAELGFSGTPSDDAAPLSFFESILSQSVPEREDITASEVAEEAAKGAVEGFAPSVTGLGTGLVFGKKGATLGGLAFGPPGAVAGGTIGFLGGFVAGSEAINYLLDDVFPIPRREELVPFRQGGITFGESISLLPISFYLPAAGPTASKVSKFLGDIRTTARASPKTTAAAALSVSTSTGIGGGTSELFYPGQAGPRFLFETTAGAINPTGLLVKAVDSARGFSGQLLSGFSKDAREYRTGAILRAALDEFSIESGKGPMTEDALNKLIARLNAPGQIGPKGEEIALTAGQKTGLPLLNAIEAALAVRHAKYSGENKNIGRKALEAQTLMLKRLEDLSRKDPQALGRLAQLRRTNNANMLEARYEAAHASAAQRIAAISKDTPSARVEIGKIVKEEIEQALKEARAVEKELWEQAYRAGFKKTKFPVEDPATGTVRMVEGLTPKKVDTQNLFLSYLDFASRSTPERMKFGVPPAVQAMMKRIGIDEVMVDKYKQGLLSPEYMETGVIPYNFLPNPKDLGGLPVPDLINIRSDLLSFARDAASKGDVGDARLFGNLAEASLEDLSALKLPAYDTARRYSKDLNDTFTRSFVGDLTATGKRGEKIPAELIVKRAFGANSDLVAMRMEQIEDASGFMLDQYQKAVDTLGPRSQVALALKELVPTAKSRITSISDAQARVMRLAATRFIDIRTGEINVDGLVRWGADNQEALKKLNLLNDFQNAETAVGTLELITKQNNAIVKKAQNQAAFYQFIVKETGETIDNPTAVITSAINSDTPVNSFGRIAKFARSGGQNSIEGLKSTVYDYAFTQASSKNGVFDPAAYERALFEPLAPNKPSLYNILRTHGIMTVKEKNDLLRLIRPIKQVQESLLRGTRAEDIVEGADPITDLALRVIGAKIGTTVSPEGSGSSLIAAAAGSKFLRTMFDKMPALSITTMIEDATKDPTLMAALLAKGKTPAQKVANRRRLQGYLFAAGYDASDPREEPEPTAKEVLVTPTTGPTAAQMLQQISPPKPPRVGPPVRGVPGITAQSPSRSPKVSGPPPTSQSRAMFQSLFPTDTISPLLNQPR